jgi:hypothetical protein
MRGSAVTKLSSFSSDPRPEPRLEGTPAAIFRARSSALGLHRTSYASFRPFLWQSTVGVRQCCKGEYVSNQLRQQVCGSVRHSSSDSD